ncbi:hypothetical protein [Niallia endozanthoxylica]|uniref:Uncharacterized protein n=1 Tax=Niallia endozanthoxylica TaxID=2036016 RepID=A0A5J5HYE9_9BACI|nr:hypothetical protein [Niallia endozanthoxylica]KAA9026975.1 hypothetical protein F4V44_06550 [Niallia endozanthoxylica]
MPKREISPANKAQLHSSENKKTKRKRRKKQSEIDWLTLFRFSFMLFLAGVIVFHYNLVIENQLGSFYVKFWNRNKGVLSPILVVSGYTFAVFLTGYYLGKRR